jgi:hypothetical protein
LVGLTGSRTEMSKVLTALRHAGDFVTGMVRISSN